VIKSIELLEDPDRYIQNKMLEILSLMILNLETRILLTEQFGGTFVNLKQPFPLFQVVFGYIKLGDLEALLKGIHILDIITKACFGAKLLIMVDNILEFYDIISDLLMNESKFTEEGFLSDSWIQLHYLPVKLSVSFQTSLISLLIFLLFSFSFLIPGKKKTKQAKYFIK